MIFSSGTRGSWEHCHGNNLISKERVCDFCCSLATSQLMSHCLKNQEKRGAFHIEQYTTTRNTLKDHKKKASEGKAGFKYKKAKFSVC